MLAVLSSFNKGKKGKNGKNGKVNLKRLENELDYVIDLWKGDSLEFKSDHDKNYINAFIQIFDLCKKLDQDDHTDESFFLFNLYTTPKNVIMNDEKRNDNWNEFGENLKLATESLSASSTEDCVKQIQELMKSCKSEPPTISKSNSASSKGTLVVKKEKIDWEKRFAGCFDGEQQECLSVFSTEIDKKFSKLDERIANLDKRIQKSGQNTLKDLDQKGKVTIVYTKPKRDNFRFIHNLMSKLQDIQLLDKLVEDVVYEPNGYCEGTKWILLFKYKDYTSVPVEILNVDGKFMSQVTGQDSLVSYEDMEEVILNCYECVKTWLKGNMN